MDTKLLEVKLKVDKAIIIESLCRIGIANKERKILYPSCYLYNKDDKFYLAHFKQLFQIIKKNSYNNFSEEDSIRRNSIAFCLKNWGMIDVEESNITPHNIYLFILPFKEKSSWQIVHKFNKDLIEYNKII